MTMNTFYGSNIKYIRKLHKQSMEDIAALSNVSKSSISDYEKGKTSPSLQFLDFFCQHFNISMEIMRTIDLQNLSSQGGMKGFGVKDFNRMFDHGDTSPEKDSIKIIAQRLEGLEVQLKLLNQLIIVKDTENKTLKVQIRLLQDRLNKYEASIFG